MIAVKLPQFKIFDFGMPKTDKQSLVSQASSLKGSSTIELIEDSKGVSTLPLDLPQSTITAPVTLQKANDTIEVVKADPKVMHPGDTLATAASKSNEDFANFSPVTNSKTIVSKVPAGKTVYIHPAQFALSLEKTTRMLQEIRISDAITQMEESKRKYTQMCKEYMDIWKSMSEEEKKRQIIATANKTLTFFSLCYTMSNLFAQTLMGSAVVNPGIGASIIGGVMMFNLWVQYNNLSNSWDGIAKQISEIFGTDKNSTEKTLKEVCNVASLVASLGSLVYFKTAVPQALQNQGLLGPHPWFQNNDLLRHIDETKDKVISVFACMLTLTDAKIEHEAKQLEGDMKLKEGSRKRQEEELQGKTSTFGSLLKFSKQIFERAQKFIQQTVIKIN